MNGREQIEYERRRQINEEGFTPDHDDEYGPEVLVAAATHYLVNTMEGFRPALPRWPWQEEWWKPHTPVRDLVRAGALMLAAAEAHHRVATTSGRHDRYRTHHGRAVMCRMAAAGIAQEIDRREEG